MERVKFQFLNIGRVPSYIYVCKYLFSDLYLYPSTVIRALSGVSPILNCFIIEMLKGQIDKINLPRSLSLGVSETNEAIHLTVIMKMYHHSVNITDK